jgi:hypothetical protein
MSLREEIWTSAICATFVLVLARARLWERESLEPVMTMRPGAEGRAF